MWKLCSEFWATLGVCRTRVRLRHLLAGYPRAGGAPGKVWPSFLRRLHANHDLAIRSRGRQSGRLRVGRQFERRRAVVTVAADAGRPPIRVRVRQSRRGQGTPPRQEMPPVQANRRARLGIKGWSVGRIEKIVPSRCERPPGQSRHLESQSSGWHQPETKYFYSVRAAPSAGLGHSNSRRPSTLFFCRCRPCRRCPDHFRRCRGL